jgi:histidyl-tRNA synthetase
VEDFVTKAGRKFIRNSRKAAARPFGWAISLFDAARGFDTHLAMALSTQPYKGTRDFYPDEMKIRRWIFERMKKVVESFGYQEYDGPMLEPFELYAAKSGEELVNQQLYWMVDRGERKIAVRPEMTPTLARMVAGKINELPKPVRWYSIPNLWRYERPQRGRLREFWQLNVDVLGGDSLQADAELMKLAIEMVRAFGGEKFVSIRVNNRRLMDQFFEEKLGLSSDKALAAAKAIDARAKIGDEAYTKLLTDLGVSEKQRLELESFLKSSFEDAAKKVPGKGADELRALFKTLKESGVSDQIVFDPTILRGLDYYTGTVFEMYDISPENNRAIFGGGRYDNLVGLFGKHTLSGNGFGLGDVTFQNFLETHKLIPALPAACEVFVGLPKDELLAVSEKVAKELRGHGFKTMTPLGADGFGNQLKLATKHGARFAVLFGETELAQNQIIVKDLAKGEQKLYPISDGLKSLAQDLEKALR